MATLAEDIDACGALVARRAKMEVALLTGCQDRPYAFGLSMALASKGISLDVIGSDEVDSPELHATSNLRFLNMRRSQRSNISIVKKAWISLLYYTRLIRYTSKSKAEIFHILWNN